MTPELELLLACARVGAPEREVEQARIRTLLRADLDWDVFLREGRWHGLLPIAFRRLQGLEAAEVPPEVTAALGERFYGMARRNLWLTARLAELVAALETRGVPVVPLKGSILAVTVYENLALREFGDLDLLIRRRDLDAACDALAAAGLKPMERWSPGQDAAFRSTWYAYGWRDTVTGVWVELHWRLAPRFFAVGIDVDQLLDATEEAGIQGRPVVCLRPEELLLSLCIHGTKDEPDPWSRLKWVQDLAEILRSRSVDWDRLLETARRAGCLRMLFVGLRLASELLAAPIPTRVVRRLEADPEALRLAEGIHGRLVDRGPATTRLQRLRFELRVRERARDRVRTLLRRALLPDSKDLTLARLPRPLWTLYFPLRLLRLLATGLARPWRIARLWKPLEERRATP